MWHQLNQRILVTVLARRRRPRKRKHHRRRRHLVTRRPKQPIRPPAPKPPAKVKPVPVAVPYVPAGAPTELELLHLNRLGNGFTPAAHAQLRASGGAAAWLQAQLNPATLAESPKIAQVDSWFPWLRKPPADKWADQQSGARGGWRYAHDFGNWSILRMVYSQRTVLEKMVAFWSDVLHVNADHDHAWVYRFDYDSVLHEHALGKFEDLLIAASLHPAMRVYLDNWLSVRNKPNENQGRELLELHTVTPAAQYTEPMVKASAVILSGYTVDWGKTFAPRYDATKHTTGPVSVLGFSDPNGAADGQSVTTAYLRYLARHPSTARTVARRLATYFVSDAPSGALVDHLAAVFTSSGTDIAATLTALANHPEFASSTGAKVRNPVADMVHTTRVLGVDVLMPTAGDNAWANHANWMHGAGGLYQWPRPDGSPIVNAPWSSASRVFRSVQMHYNQSGGWWPKDATYRTVGATWLPAGNPTRLDQFVDHLARQLLGRPAPPQLITAVSQAIDSPVDSVVTVTHRAVTWMFPRLMTTILDTPEHMTS